MNSEQSEEIPFAPLQEASERLLTHYHETSVTIEQAALLTEPERRNRIWRCHLKAAHTVLPATVIIKQVSPDGYNPSTPEAWDTTRFFNDWAGAQFLTECIPEDTHGPHFYGGNSALGFIILEDMGEHNSLVQPLLEGTAAAASDALIAFSTRLGRMHAGSIGKEERYRQIQRDISPAWAENSVTVSHNAEKNREKQLSEFTEICARLGVEPDQTAKQDLQEALQRITDPGPFTTFIHSDPCPDNVFYNGSDLKLIDFEFSCFGHALQDGLYGRLPFPTCWCANTVPADIVQRMETAYRAELSTACPEAQNDTRFAQEASAIAASWVLNSLKWHLEAALPQDEKWGIASIRSRILTRIETFLANVRTADQLPSLRDTSEKLLTELHRRWPEATPLPLYPAFRTVEPT